MADDLIPAVQSGEGPAARSVPAIGPDYRSLQAPAVVNTDLPDNGAAAKAAVLAGTFKDFTDIGFKYEDQLQTKAGALAGAASGATGHPDYKQGLTQFTAFSRAFNNAATGAYAVQAEAQADDAAARLRVQANNDPGAFFTTFSAVRDGVLKNAPAQAVPMLTELYNKHLAAGMAAISGDQAEEIKQKNSATYQEGVQRQVSRVALLQGSNKPGDDLLAMDEHVKLTALIHGGVEAGLYSPAAAESMSVNAERAIFSQVFSTTVDSTIANGGDIVGLMDNFRQMHLADLGDTTKPPTLSESEYQKLYADATTKVREYNMLVAYSKRDGRTAEELKFEAGGRQATVLALKGQLSRAALAGMVDRGEVKDSEARAITGLMDNANVQPKSDSRAILRVQTDPDFLDKTNAEIASTPGINSTDSLKLIDIRDKRKAGIEGTAQVRDAKAAIAAALNVKGKNSAGLSDEERNAVATASVDLVTRLNKLPASEQVGSVARVAQEVIKDTRRQQAATDVNTLTMLRDSNIKAHSPGGGDVWPKEKMDAYIAKKNAAIKDAQDRAK